MNLLSEICLWASALSPVAMRTCQRSAILGMIRVQFLPEHLKQREYRFLDVLGAFEPEESRYGKITGPA
jgi:hypothetical protein